VTNTAAGKMDDVVREYVPPGERRPLAGYLALMATYGTALAGAAVAVRLTGRRLPERIAVQDLAMITVAAHKLSRIVTKDSVTSPLRAPFTRFEASAGAAELNETVRHQGGFKHAVGELLTCPFCTAVWASTAMTVGMIFAPRLTRLVAAAGTSVAGADFLHLAYDIAKKKAEGGEQ
jgi:hypothetical protein